MSGALSIILDAEEGMPRPKAVSVKQDTNRVRVAITMESPADVRTVAQHHGAEVTVSEVGTGWRYRNTSAVVEAPGLIVHIGACELAAPGESLPQLPQAVAA